MLTGISNLNAKDQSVSSYWICKKSKQKGKKKEKYLGTFLDINLVTNELTYEGHCPLTLA